MALTREGKALTERHRVEQLRISARADRDIRTLWQRMKMVDLDQSTPYWTALMLRVVGMHYKTSQSTAGEYLVAYRTAETGSAAGPIQRPPLNVAEATVALRIAGPVALKKSISRGISAESAHRFGVDRVRAASQQIILGGGRDLIDQSARANRRSGRYRRVTDGQPCAFCAMLASRGPAYSDETAYFRAHDHCGCTAEEAFGGWEPTALEYKWRDAYDEAAEAATAAGQVRRAGRGRGRYEDTILRRMRRSHPELFSDGVIVKP